MYNDMIDVIGFVGKNDPEVAERMEKEASIETLIKAKGFEKVVAVIGDKDVTVIVSAEALLPSQTLQIQDAVTSQTEISLQNIKIVCFL
mgnify:CR=1 FL=1